MTTRMISEHYWDWRYDELFNRLRHPSFSEPVFYGFDHPFNVSDGFDLKPVPVWGMPNPPSLYDWQLEIHKRLVDFHALRHRIKDTDYWEKQCREIEMNPDNTHGIYVYGMAESEFKDSNLSE